MRATFSRRGQGVDEQATGGLETGRTTMAREQGVGMWPAPAEDVFTGLAD